jgi:hypothetical protein
MIVIDEILNEWAYRCHDGIVDINDPIKMSILNEILNEYDLKLNEDNSIDYTKTLNAKEVAKNRKVGGYRGNKVISFINDKKPFTLKDGSEVVLDFINDEIQDIFTKYEYNKLTSNQIVFTDNNGSEYKLEDIVKTADFGGKVKGFSTKHETSALNEFDALIKNILQEKGIEFINVKINEDIYENIVGAVNQPGVPKSDFNLITIENTPIVFISHKMGGGSRSFARWGGFIFAAKEGNPEVVEFIQNISNKIENNTFERNTSFAQKINSQELKNRIVFGKDFGKEYSKNNVQLVIQGKIELNPTQEENTYTITGENIWSSGQTPTDDFEPVLEAHYRGDFTSLSFKSCESFSRPISTIPTTTTKFNW